MAERDRVRLRGLIARAGHYPDKSYTITPEDLGRACSEWDGPLPIDLEHTSTILDGQLGELEGVELAENGRALVGTVAIPQWLAALVGDRPLRVSATWERATKRLRGLSLVLRPRIEDAALVAAFSRSTQADMMRVGFRDEREGAAIATYHRLRRGYIAHRLALETAERRHDTAIGFGFLRDPDWFGRLRLATFAAGDGGHWVTIDGHPVYIGGAPIDKSHINAAAKAHGLSHKAKLALHAAHEAGKLQTDEHLYHAIAIGKAHQAASIAAGTSQAGKPLHESAMKWGLKHGTISGLQANAEGHADQSVQEHAKNVLPHVQIGAGEKQAPPARPRKQTRRPARRRLSRNSSTT